MTNYQMWQLEKYGNIAPLIQVNGDVFENGVEEMERLAEWVEIQAERELHEHEQSYNTEY